MVEKNKKIISKSDPRLSQFIDSATDCFTLWDANFDLIMINKTGQKMFNLKKEDILGKNMLELVPNVKETGRYFKHKKVMETGKPFYESNFVPHSSFGDKHLDVRSFRAGDMLGMITTDITKRIETLEALHAQEKNFKDLAENAGVGILIAVDTGTHVYANKCASKITGYSIKELLKIGVSGLINKKDQKKILAYTDKRIQNKPVIKSYETVFIRKDKTKIIVEIEAARTFWKSQAASMAIFKDITNRKNLEKKIFEMSKKLIINQENERKRISREIHDDLAQSLVALKLSMQCDNLESMSRAELKMKNTKIIKSINDIIQKTRSIAAMIRPSILEGQDLNSAIENIISEYSEKFQIKIKLSIDNLKKLVDSDLKINILRIVQEALMNIAKHANASTVNISIEKNQDYLYLKIKDNGIGFNTELRNGDKKGIGINIIKERVELLHGTIQIKSTINKGASLNVKVPLKNNTS
ncbi:MAG: PAS domain-containing sensor histidine kinase [Pseudomonadota bacterium]